ncbi:molybdopterin-guanine dinucleotide biosynthesis protein B [Cohaesibacter intestini]|uniref:molybdopterin-guanine dinucleotide biosynthesis protein B n=1 Tax=Cohaesibacter intestini TaxID=2211145 RepID=UPI000DEA82BA|nr:molybdopterin-guanine dinucleotide biosynthesis protein B [Cohaesibacter intestini]
MTIKGKESAPRDTPFIWHGHKVFGVTGWKNSGKTTLVTRLIAELSGRGYRISSVKHAHHACDIDKPGTDSFRHREAGSREVALVAAGTRWALMHECRDAWDEEPFLGDILPRFSPCDLVVVEGYKNEAFPKLEVRRADAKDQTPLSPDDNNIVAIASETIGAMANPHNLPEFQLDQVRKIADFIINRMQLPPIGK